MKPASEVPAWPERCTAELVEPHTLGAEAFQLEVRAWLPSDEAYPCPYQDGRASYVAVALCQVDRTLVQGENLLVVQTLAGVALFPAGILHLEASCLEGEIAAAYRSKLVGLTFAARSHSGFITLSQSILILALNAINSMMTRILMKSF
jgi:hypothetical protein